MGLTTGGRSCEHEHGGLLLYLQMTVQRFGKDQILGFERSTGTGIYCVRKCWTEDSSGHGKMRLRR